MRIESDILSWTQLALQRQVHVQSELCRQISVTIKPTFEVEFDAHGHRQSLQCTFLAHIRLTNPDKVVYSVLLKSAVWNIREPTAGTSCTS